VDAEGLAFTEDLEAAQVCYVIGSTINVTLNRLHTVLLSELTDKVTSMTRAQKEDIYRGVLKKLNVDHQSVEAQESHFDVVTEKEKIPGALIRPTKAVHKIFANFFLLYVLPLFSQPKLCITFGSDLADVLRNFLCEKGYDDQLYRLFVTTIMEVSKELGNVLDLDRQRLDILVDNLVDTSVDYIVKVLVSEAVLQLMTQLLADENGALRTVSFRHSVLSRLVTDLE
jgi:hypothetical protein